jgi:predicted nucleotidyltransferase
MLKNDVINIKVIEKVAKALEELNNRVVYIGGAIVSFYITDTGAEQPRPTKDIDISVQISTYYEMDQFREQLATKGIFPASDQPIINRFEFEDVIIDFIPFEDTPLGPTNKWIKPGFEFAQEVKALGQVIKILPVGYFLATKFEAFKARGKNDPFSSHDFEDIIYVLDNHIEVVEHIKNSDLLLIHFMIEMATYILNHPSRIDIISGNINPFTRDERTLMVIDKLEQIKTIVVLNPQ